MGLFSIEDWERNRIRIDDELRKYFDDFNTIERLRKVKTATTTTGMTAASCYNELTDENFGEEFEPNEDDLWEFYVQKDNMITWRREEGEGNYVYKGNKHDKRECP